jgi:hypothetical protein
MANILSFSEDFDTMTYPECLSFIARSRRQIDRLEKIAPEGASIDRGELAYIRRGFDELEQRIHSHLDDPTH